MKRVGAAVLLAAALLSVLAPVASAAEGTSADPSPVGGMGGGPYIGDVQEAQPGSR
jgi:Spy/CpxP family protein refolding chaperone